MISDPASFWVFFDRLGGGRRRVERENQTPLEDEGVGGFGARLGRASPPTHPPAAHCAPSVRSSTQRCATARRRRADVPSLQPTHPARLIARQRDHAHMFHPTHHEHRQSDPVGHGAHQRDDVVFQFPHALPEHPALSGSSGTTTSRRSTRQPTSPLVPSFWDSFPLPKLKATDKPVNS